MATPFQYRKITQAINFFAEKENNKTINVTKVVKLLWAADRYHLRKYGRLLTCDNYVAMERGPVGSTVKDIAEESNFLPAGIDSYSTKYLKPRQYVTQSCREADMKVFSQTDIEALEFANTNFGSMSQSELTHLSHQYPEWKRFEGKLKSKASLKEDIDFLDFFLDPNPENVPDDKFKMDDELLALSKDIFSEETEITGLLS